MFARAQCYRPCGEAPRRRGVAAMKRLRSTETRPADQPHPRLDDAAASPSLNGRGNGNEQTAAQQLRKAKLQINDAVEDLSCPIAKDGLMVDPHFASDGYVYERVQIERWLDQRKEHHTVVSPMTGVHMQKNLYPATCVKGYIQHLVGSGLLEPEVVEHYEAKRKEQQKWHSRLAAAEGGNAEAMFKVANAYAVGNTAVTKDGRKAREWYRRGAELQHAASEGAYGELLVAGIDGKRDVAMGIFYLMRAVEGGDNVGTFRMGMILADAPKYGTSEISTNYPVAKAYLTRVVTGKCTSGNLKEECLQAAHKQLEKLKVLCGFADDTDKLDKPDKPTDAELFHLGEGGGA